jgi:ABC-type transporter Mla subunit MlaD
MSDHIQQAIDSLEQEIEAIDQRRGELQRAIDAMRPLAGNGKPTFRKRKTKIPTKRAAKRNERTNERTSNTRANSDGASEPP